MRIEVSRSTFVPKTLKLSMTPAIREWPNRKAAVEKVFVMLGLTWLKDI